MAEQCPASYFDGSGSICCQLNEGHRGPHLDDLGDWAVKVALYRRRRLRLSDAETLLREALDLGQMGEDWNDRARSWLEKQDRATQAGGTDDG